MADESDIEAPELLAAFLKANELTQVDCARAVSISPVALHYYMTRRQRPRPAVRKQIAKWTGGAVPEESWETAEERLAVANIEPFQPQHEEPPSENGHEPPTEAA